jgi:septum formation protein
LPGKIQNFGLDISQHPVILLASNSPRRRELIALGNWTVSVSVSEIDERQRAGEAPADYVLRLAESKARAAVKDARAGQLIVAADTAVVDGNAILGKPKDMADAARMLKALRGHKHQVYSGLAVLKAKDGRLLKDLCVTDVPMRNYSEVEIEAYVLTGDPLDKAGAYAIQHPQFRPVESMHGCYAAVMGLPLCHLLRVLQKMGVTPNEDVPANCQAYLHYPCPVSRAILRGEQVG